MNDFPVRGSRRAVSHFILILGAAVMLFPFVWMVLTSFKTYEETMRIPIVMFPSSFKLDNYGRVLTFINFGRYYANSIFVTVCVTAGQLLIASFAAYGFARLKFKGRDILFFLVLSVYMIPPQMLLIPRYVIMDRLGWVDTYKALIVPNLCSAYATFFMRQFFLTLPRELEEAAKIDGCSLFAIFWRIYLPLTKSALVALGIYTAMWAWNDLLWPLIITSSDSKRMLSVGIAAMKGQYFTEDQLMMAAGVMVTIPIIALFIVGQKHFIQGIATTGIKG